MNTANCIHGESGPCECFAKTEPREYQKGWIGEEYPLVTRYGTVTIQPLGWGVRVQTRFKYGHTIPEEWDADAVCDPFLTINGRRSRLGWMDYSVNEKGEVEEGKLTQTDDGLSRNAEQKIVAELRPLVLAWLAEHAREFTRTRAVYVSNTAQTCEESIRELEDALDVYRARLVRIEAGEQDVSPYLNGGRRLVVDE